MAIFCCAFLIASPALTFAKGKPGGGGDPGGGGGNDTALVEIIVDGAVEAIFRCEDALSASSSDIICNHDQDAEIILGELFLNLIDASEECFVRDTGTATYSATVQIFDNKDGSAESWLRWHAPDTTGDSILYVLEIHDPFGWSGAFPPAIGDSDSIFMEGDTWVLRASNKRQSRDACLGSGNFDGLALTSVDLTRIF